ARRLRDRAGHAGRPRGDRRAVGPRGAPHAAGPVSRDPRGPRGRASDALVRAEALPVDTRGMTAPFVTLDGVEKTYRAPGRVLRALDRTTFTLGRGEFVSIVGPSGCGKSTLLMLIAGLIPATAGAVAIQGERVTRPYTDVGVVFQQDALLAWRSVLDNVLLQIDVRRLPRRRYTETAHALLARVGL